MNLIIDEGNTRIKLAVFEDSQLIDLQFSNVDNCKEDINNIIEEYIIKATVLSSVTDCIISIFNELPIVFKVILSKNTPLPFLNLYKTPETLGVDRLALATAACQKYEEQNTLVIDAGSCITYDFITNEKKYLGGAIAPGLQMRFKAMHHFTQKLPELSITEWEDRLIGRTTSESMISGVLNGIMFEVDGVINTYRHKYGKVNVILTGGDANCLCKQLKNSIFVNPNFLLEGLNEVLTYQIKHETKSK